MSTIKSIPAEWRSVLKASTDVQGFDSLPNTPTRPQPILGTSSKQTLKEFHYKILNCIVFVNEKLSRMGLVESPNCAFCQEITESVEQLLFSCKTSSDFWKHVLSWLRDNNNSIIDGAIDESDLILEKFNIVNDFILINHILLLGKYCICCRRCLNSLPTLRSFYSENKACIKYRDPYC